MTESEARKKWCPMSANSKALWSIAGIIPLMCLDERGVSAGLDVVTDSLPKSIEKCVASDCMCWRLDDPEAKNTLEKPENWNNGHCGLAK
jgi:hypothetical protein